METRRSFLKKSMMGCLAVSLPGLTACAAPGTRPGIKNRIPGKALVLWYSQTGHTGRIGKVIGYEWRKAGLTVDLCDYRDIAPSKPAGYDLVALGSPVYYMDVPDNLREWIRGVPAMEGIPVAAFVTYGGHGDGQHNTACGILEEMARKGAVPVGMDTFGNMSTFAPTWSMGNEKRILEYKDRPNEQTYARAQQFAIDLLEKVRAGRILEIDREFGMDTLGRLIPQVWFTKLLITNHHIDTGECIECGLCQEKCPVAAIDLQNNTIDHHACLACMGCINNCPVGAVRMTFMGRDVYGFQTFLKQHQIKIMEPEL